jgi:DnaK suppressor protein
MKGRARRLDAKLVDEFRRRLLEAREALLRAVAATDEEMAGLEAPAPGDSTDRAATSSATSLVSRLGGQDKRELDEIADALRRLGSHAYGFCQSCRAPIALPRLRAVPATRFCLTCQEAEEVTP